MSEIKDRNTENMVQEKEMKLWADMYKNRTPANRFFMVSASGLLLASQSSTYERCECSSNA